MKNVGRYLLILIGAIVLWNTFIMKPLRIFTVFLHELGHTAMAFAFGYGIKEFKVNFNESGYTIVQSKGWFSSFMIANGGYLGSVLFALLILLLKDTFFKKYILGTIAIGFLVVTIRFSGLSFALIYAVIFAVAVLVIYMAQNDKLNDWIIDIIGIASVAYAVYDTFVDTILLQINLQFNLINGWRSGGHVTDAMQLSKMTGIPAIVWGIIWLAIALAAVYALLRRKSKVYGGRRR
ncbi:peptidase M50B-like protein [Anaerobacterium chartisolvens]|uniref:Peptidase M50B-like protein n=1 Tax=Anaerobacterium chartisolvens TaxID=1297424 RepID=A0A369B538_9FIRM|nr:M50 family metallopeptidase [Anaerobacterium chartisolvens]RCX16629.1 peptidase M50B-like protein [Anaerobacterium chartisolvens]